MSNTLSALRNKSSLSKLTQALDSMSSSQKKDERFWQPDVDKAGNGYAVIRFLDAPKVDGEAGLPWVQAWSHGFQGPGGWLIEECPTTLGKTCPVCEHNSKLWNSKIEANKDEARKQKRKLKYISNILVVKDANRPENEGKVFLFQYGKKIFEKINEQIKPQFEDETAVNPFNFWEGANFKLKIRKFEGYRNYDKSEFDAPSCIGSDEMIEKLWTESHSLKELLDPAKFKSYEDLKARLDKVFGAVPASRVAAAKPKVDEEVAQEEGNRKSDDNTPPWDSDDEETLSYFSKLAEED